jgi:hypothetical protein
MFEGQETLFGTSFLFCISTVSTFAIVTLFTDTKIKTVLLGTILLIVAHGLVGILLAHNDTIGRTMHSYVEQLLEKLFKIFKETKSPLVNSN